MAQSPRILSAKTVYFDNETGSDAVGKNALAQLKKWGKLQIVTERKQADLIFLLSADAYKGGDITFASGQTGSVENGHVTEDAVPNYNKQSPTRYAYLTVIDPKTGDNLWSDKHLWGGLLTGFNSVGERLIKELESQTKKQWSSKALEKDPNQLPVAKQTPYPLSLSSVDGMKDRSGPLTSSDRVSGEAGFGRGRIELRPG